MTSCDDPSVDFLCSLEGPAHIYEDDPFADGDPYMSDDQSMGPEHNEILSKIRFLSLTVSCLDELAADRTNPLFMDQKEIARGRLGDVSQSKR